ncbi:hypothetical protein [Kibdelosporangium aridum]|uniref:hypothetical protein n=1 Tax=Kibdelosporangium aridum TaxID=2030 RepID=UPI0035ECF6EF
MTQAAQRSGFRSAFGVREFRALWAAEALSQLGDQLARVALAVLVYSRTNSAALAALTIALSYTPSFLGSALLSGLADRFPPPRGHDRLRSALGEPRDPDGAARGAAHGCLRGDGWGLARRRSL